MKVKNLHGFDLTNMQAVSLQKKLSRKIRLVPLKTSPRLVAGCDISFNLKDPTLYAGVVVMDMTTMKVVEERTTTEKALFPYIPGLLAFRELPPLLKIFRDLKICPQAVICDGQGIAHPRRMGLASHLGLFLGLPTVGAAKSLLTGSPGEVRLPRWSTSPLKDGEEVIGHALRTRQGVKPVYVSPGHLIDFQGALDVVKRSVSRYRLPEPTRQAHFLVNRLRKESA